MTIFSVDTLTVPVTKKCVAVPIYSSCRKVPIAIDLGSYECRAGFANVSSPQCVFEPQIHRYQSRVDSRTFNVVGNFPIENATKLTTKGGKNFQCIIAVVYDQNVIYQYDGMESIFDHVFSYLGVKSQGFVDHPVILSEVFCNLGGSRRQMTELLFEGYNVPKLAYAIDFACSAYQNGLDSNGLIISCSHLATHVAPVINGSIDYSNCKRINIGGHHSTDFLLKLIQLKYPTFPSRMTWNQAHALLHQHTYVADDYSAELNEIVSDLSSKSVIIQFPFQRDEISEEEKQQRLERKREHAKRMKENNEKMRVQKLASKEKELEELEELKNTKMKKKEFQDRLKRLGLDNENHLNQVISKLQITVKKMKQRLDGIEPEPEPQPKVIDFSLLEKPDAELDEQEIKEKKRLRIVKVNMETRERIKAEKEKVRQELKQKEEEEEKRRLNDPEGYVQELHEKRKMLLAKIKERKKKKEQKGERKSQVSKQRLKQVAALAVEETTIKKRKKEVFVDDGFGMRDSDWSVYREISREDEDEEDEEEDQLALEETETLLEKYDPTFDYEEEHKDYSSILYKLKHGTEPNDDLSADYQIHLNVERIRAPELMFQPTMIGVDQSGLSEVILHILKKYPLNIQEQLLNNVFLTGGNSHYPNLDKRILSTLQMNSPVGAKINVKRANDASWDAWRGLANISSRNDIWMTKSYYDEHGSDYLQEHSFSNLFYSVKEE